MSAACPVLGTDGRVSARPGSCALASKRPRLCTRVLGPLPGSARLLGDTVRGTTAVSHGPGGGSQDTVPRKQADTGVSVLTGL